MKKVKNFKQFESVTNQLNKNDIRDLFIELIDDGFVIKFFDNHFFELRRDRHEIPDEEYGWIDGDRAYGVTDFDAIDDQLNKVKRVVREAKERIEDSGYKIGFEMEFHFGQPALMYIAGHMDPGVDNS